MPLFRRGAPQPLVAVATAEGWPELALGAPSMLPPSHQDADTMSLGDRVSPSLGGWSYAPDLRSPAGHVLEGATATHLIVFHDDRPDDEFEMIRWPTSLPVGGRIEVKAGGPGWNHHRLPERFGPAGWLPGTLADGTRTGVGRDVPATVAQRLAASAWGPELVVRAGAARGLTAEVDKGRAAVYRWGSRQLDEAGWLALRDAAAAWDALLQDACATPVA